MTWAIEKIFAPRCGVRMGCVVATDDWICIAEKGHIQCAVDLVRQVLEGAGFTMVGKRHPDIPDPLDWPGQITVWIGYGLDFPAGRRFIPPSYLVKVLAQLLGFVDGSTSLTIHLVESLQGRGVWCGGMCAGLQPFLQPLVDLAGLMRKFGLEHTKKAVERARDTARLLLQLLPRMAAGPGRAFVDPEPRDAREWLLITDSTCGSDDGVIRPAFGVFVMGAYVSMEWPERALDQARNVDTGRVDNGVLEQMARGIGVVLLDQLWPEGVEGKTIHVHQLCDNQGSVGQAHRGRARNEAANNILLGLACRSAVRSFDVSPGEEVQWVATKQCYYADPLSRAHGSSAAAEKAKAEFRDQVAGRPTRKITLDVDSPLFDWRDPMAIADLQLNLAPLHPTLLHAWRPAQESSEETPVRFRKGAAGLGAGTSAQAQYTGFVMQEHTGCPSSLTLRQSDCESDTSTSSLLGGSSSWMDTSLLRSTDTLTTSRTCTERSSTAATTSWGNIDRSDGGGDSSGDWRNEPHSELTRRRKSCWRRSTRGTSEEKRTSPSLVPLRSLGLERCEERSTARGADGDLEHFNFAGGVYYSSIHNSANASSMTPTCKESGSRCTARATGVRTDNGCLCTLLRTPPFVQSDVYKRWQGVPRCLRMHQYSRLRMARPSPEATSIEK